MASWLLGGLLSCFSAPHSALHIRSSDDPPSPAFLTCCPLASACEAEEAALCSRPSAASSLSTEYIVWTLDMSKAQGSRGLRNGMGQGAAGPDSAGLNLPAVLPTSSTCSMNLCDSVVELLDGVALYRSEPQRGADSATFRGMWRGAQCSVKFIRMAPAALPQLQGAIGALTSQSHPYLLQYYATRVCHFTPAAAALQQRSERRPHSGLPPADLLLSVHGLSAAMAAEQLRSRSVESILGSAFCTSMLGEEHGMLCGAEAGRALLDALRPSANDYVVALVCELCLLGNLQRAIEGRVFQGLGGGGGGDVGDVGGGGSGSGWGWSAARVLRAVVCSAREVCLGVLHLHALGSAHCNLRPSNVQLLESHADGRGFMAKVSDTGLGPRHASSADCGSRDVPPGQPELLSYTAPESLTWGCRAATVAELQAADVYSLGCLLYEMWPSECDVPAPLQQLCCRCLSPDPAARPGVDALVGQLNAIDAALSSSCGSGSSSRRSSATGPVPCGALAADLAKDEPADVLAVGRLPNSLPLSFRMTTTAAVAVNVAAEAAAGKLSGNHRGANSADTLEWRSAIMSEEWV